MPQESTNKSSSSSSSTNNKVSQTVVSQEEEESPSEEVWDIVHIISKKEEKCICRTEDCQGTAVATWASNLDPEDKWNLCEACQESDFGGWPEDLPNSTKNDPNDPRHPSTEQSSPETKPDTTETTTTTTTSTTIGTKSTTIAPVTQATQEEPEQEETKSPSDSSPSHVDQVQDSTDLPKSQINDNNNDSNKGTITITQTENPTTPSTQESPDAEDTTRPTPVPTKSEEEEGAESPQQDSNAEQEEGDDEEEEEIWDLQKMITMDNLNKDATIKCSTEDCLLSACSVWVSNLDPKTKWYSCLDCQENDFGGWPSLDALPIKSVQANHLQLIARKCSNQSKPSLPELPLNISIASSTTCNSPCPTTSKDGSSSTSKTNSTTSHFVTPPPPLQKKKQQPNPKALAIHNKWQAAAEAIGGKDVRIVVSKAAAKKLISGFLYDAFRPMNITEVYKALKAIVPSPVLSACLQEMALDKDDNRNPFADDSDDEEENISKKANNSSTTPTPSDPYSGSLQLKIGKSQASNLYYVDYNKRKILDAEERNELLQTIATSNATEEVLKETWKSTLAQADKLLSEPTNEVIAEQLEIQSAAVLELEEKVQEAMKLKVNEKHKQTTKRKIQNMTAQWRRRKRMCMDFLIALEENTDGSIRAKKCLTGDGPIALDSDEVVAKAAVEFAKKKRARRQSQPSMKGRKALKTSKTQNPNSAASSLADEDFVAVNLDSQHCVRRIHLDDHGDEN